MNMNDENRSDGVKNVFDEPVGAAGQAPARRAQQRCVVGRTSAGSSVSRRPRCPKTCLRDLRHT